MIQKYATGSADILYNGDKTITLLVNTDIEPSLKLFFAGFLGGIFVFLLALIIIRIIDRF